MSAQRKLTAAVRKAIVSYIRQGGFPHMAAEAAIDEIGVLIGMLGEDEEPAA